MDTYQAWRSDNLFELGSGHVVICRKRGDGRVQAAVMLVDLYCLGVRDVFLAEESESDFEELRERINSKDPLAACTPAYGRKLIDESIAYAGQFGFAPPRDYRKAKKVLNRIDPGECKEEIPMGKDGKPFYIQSPSHDEAFANRVLTALERKLGLDGFEYILTGSDDEDWDDDEDPYPPYVLLSEYPRGASPETEKLSCAFEHDLYSIVGDMELEMDEASPGFAEIFTQVMERSHLILQETKEEGAPEVTLSQFMEISLLRMHLGLLPEDERDMFLKDLEKTDPENAANLRALMLEEDENLREMGLDPSDHGGRLIHWRVTPPQTPDNPGDRPHVLIAYAPEY